METSLNPADHDLLVTLVANVGSMRDEMRQNNLQSTTQAADHEARLRVLEKNATSQAGTNEARKQMSSTVKWVIATLIATLAVMLTAIGILVAQR